MSDARKPVGVSWQKGPRKPAPSFEEAKAVRIKKIEMFETPDGKRHDSYNKAAKHIEAQERRANIRRWVDIHWDFQSIEKSDIADLLVRYGDEIGA